MQPQGGADPVLQDLSDFSAEIEQAVPIDQHNFCRALYVREARDKASAQLRAGRNRCSLWGLGCLSVLSILMVLGVSWLVRDYEITPPPLEYQGVVREFNNTRANDTVTDNADGLPERPLQSPEPWIFDEEKSVADATNQNGTGSFCDTAECQRTAAFLEQQLDPTFGPCESLYDHVCTRWREKHAKSPSARRRGSYSIDDAILDSHRRKLVRRLSVDDTQRPFRKLRSFFLQCTRSQLTSRYEVEEIKALLELGSSPSVVALATTIVRLARMGFSPFFDVSVTGYPDTFRVRLFRPSGSREGPASDWLGSYASSKRRSVLKASGIAANSTNSNDTEQTLFLRLLGRIICAEIVRSVPSANKKCSFDAESAMHPAWNYGWYKSTGVELLTLAVDRELGPLVLGESTAFDENGAGSPSVIDSAGHRRWRAETDLRDACVNLMARHDPYLLSYWSAISTEASRLEERAKESLREIMNVVARKFAFFGDLSTSYGLPAEFENFTTLSTHQADLYGDELQGSRMLRFLSNSTWKLWLGTQVHRRGGAFGTAADTFETAPSVIAVPEPVFNLTALKDPWLRLLAAVRYTPRVLWAVFRRNFSEELMSSSFGQCASKYFSLPDEDDSVDPRRRIEAYLGALELTAFHAALDVYRAKVGGRTETVPGTDLDGDSFFLFSYVFNECEVLSVRKNREVARYTVASDASSSRRKFFPKISNLLAKVLLPGCKASGVQLTNCGVEAAAVAMGYENGTEDAANGSP
ncbi:uncharacterized protein [Dermacentor albipictus]|uniref:uncharacterized protein n=1 Tax=Dermacentor albipictus TaxID=60249 RepID=UPI0038FC15CD